MPFFENTEILRRDVQVLDRILIFNNGNQNPFFGILVEDLYRARGILTRGSLIIPLRAWKNSGIHTPPYHRPMDEVNKI